MCRYCAWKWGELSRKNKMKTLKEVEGKPLYLKDKMIGGYQSWRRVYTDKERQQAIDEYYNEQKLSERSQA